MGWRSMPFKKKAWPPPSEFCIVLFMLNFSKDPAAAEKQMHAVIFYLSTFGFIDGDFDATEEKMVADYLRLLVVHRVETGLKDASAEAKAEAISIYTTRFIEEFQRIKQQIMEYYTEAVTNDESQADFVRNKLKLHCFEIFKSFDDAGQEALLTIVDALLMADGVVHPAEVDFRAELSSLLEAELEVELLESSSASPLEVCSEIPLAAVHDTHPFFAPFEHHYSRLEDRLHQQIEGDQRLLEKTAAMFELQRTEGNGRLAGHRTVAEFGGSNPFLDGHVYVVPTPPGKRFDLTVLGDLHGCYSCLKAALLQSNFFDKVEAYKKDPANNPDPKLILLGDYIDRGRFSLNGVLRAVMTIAAAAPEHVYMLRGNHEYYLEYKGEVFGGVRPAEAINSLKPYVPVEVFRRYTRFFEAMPNMLMLGKMLFVHGGIPKDAHLKTHYQDLSSLNDKDLRFQMMWSDPSTADIIPSALQAEAVRFSFGRLQAAAFLQRIGCRALIRGHEKVNEGFVKTYHDDKLTLLTLFSAGGAYNQDLPEDSGYRSVSPAALTMNVNGDDVTVTPWKIDYESYNSPQRNSFFLNAGLDDLPGI